MYILKKAKINIDQFRRNSSASVQQSVTCAKRTDGSLQTSVFRKFDRYKTRANLKAYIYLSGTNGALLNTYVS
jgi:hypothetical protein